MHYNINQKRINKKWTLQDLLVVAKPYKTRSSFKKQHQAAYYSTLRQKLATKVFAHMECGNKLKAYNLIDLIKIAKKYKTRDEFKIKARGAYDAARRMNKLELVCKHMPKFAVQNRYEEQVVHPKFKKMFVKNNISFKHEFSLNRKAKPDFIVFNKKNEVMIIEIKADNKIHTDSELKIQLNKYLKYGKMFFKNKFKGVLLASETGTYGLCLKQLEKEMIQFTR